MPVPSTSVTPEIAIATPEDRGRIVATLVSAFPADPVLRYLFPDDDTYPGHAAAFFGHLFDTRVHRNAIWTIESGASVAIWEPPGADGSAAGGSLEEQLPADALSRLTTYDDAVHALLPTTPFWYLGVLGTHPDRAGRRWGRAVMAHGVAAAARDGVPAILETSSPGNVDVYRRAGWEVVSSAEDPVPFWVMQHSGHGSR